MREFDSIAQEEFDNRKKNMDNLLNEPYLSILQEKIRRLILRADSNEFSTESGEKVPVMKPDVKEEFERINKDIELFKKVKYPDLLIDIQEKEKLEMVEILKQDEAYGKLINGVNYFSLELDYDEEAISEISLLNKHISNLIDKKFPDLFA